MVEHKLTDQKRDDYNEIIEVFDQFSLKGFVEFFSVNILNIYVVCKLAMADLPTSENLKP